MSILRRVEMLEAAVPQNRDDVEYKLVLLEEGESCGDGRIRAGLKDWPSDRIFIIEFVSAQEKSRF